MKSYKPFTFCLVFLFASLLYAQPIPVGQWTFDEGFGTTTADISGNGNDGTIYGAIFTDNTPSGNGYALEFDGSSAVHIGDPDILKIEEGDISICAWISYNTLRLQNFYNLCVKGHSDASPGEIVLRVNIREKRYQISSYDGGLDHAASIDIDSADFGQWIHLTGTYSAVDQKWRLYKNGELGDVSPVETGPVPVEDNGWAIGAKCSPTEKYPTERHFVGIIDDVRIYDVALTDEDVLAIYNEAFTDVESIASDVPANFKLVQNYPNPFNPATTITYSLPEKSFVTLRVFNLLGKEVTTLVSDEQPAGEYRVKFNSSEIAELPSGIYMYVLKAGVHKEARKMIFMK
jgi:hypothetical protein